MPNKKNIKSVVGNKKFLLRILAILSSIFLLAFSIFITLRALQKGISMDTSPANGTFQLYNPLRRLASGEIIGKDFQFFHGAGVPWIHYPFFNLLGGNIFAAETLKWFMSPFIFLVSSSVFFYAFFRNLNKTLIATSIFTIIAITFIDGVIIGGSITLPGGSLKGLRGSFPIFVAAALLWQTKRHLKIGHLQIKLNEIAAIALIGFSFVMGTEHGIASSLAYLIVSAILLFRTEPKKRIIALNIVYRLLLICLTFLIFMVLLTKGHPNNALLYAFSEAPNDQGWYFGVPPNTYLSWSNLIPRLISENFGYLWGIIIVGFVATYTFVKDKDNELNKRIVGIFFLLYGFIVFGIAIFGYYAPGIHLAPLQRVLGLMLIAIFVDHIFQPLKRGRAKSQKTNYNLQTIKVVIALLVLSIILLISASHQLKLIQDFQIKHILSTAKSARKNGDYFAASPTWQHRVDIFAPHIKPDSTIWSTYTGLYDSIYGQYSAAKGGEDYIIHALGKERRENYLQDFKTFKPDYVITTNPKTFIYEEWLWSNSWHFYKHLINNYTLISVNDSHYLWELSDSLKVQENEWIKLEKNNGKYPIPKNDTEDISVYEIQAKYKISTGLLNSKDRLSRYLLTIQGASSMRYPVSLPPYLNSQTFIIVLMPNESNATISAQAVGMIPWAKLNLESLEYRKLKLKKENIRPFIDNYCSISSHRQIDKICNNL